MWRVGLKTLPGISRQAQAGEGGVLLRAKGCRLLKLGDPLNNALHAQRVLKRAAVVSCLDGKGGSLS